MEVEVEVERWKMREAVEGLRGERVNDSVLGYKYPSIMN